MSELSELSPGSELRLRSAKEYRLVGEIVRLLLPMSALEHTERFIGCYRRRTCLTPGHLSTGQWSQETFVVLLARVVRRARGRM